MRTDVDIDAYLASACRQFIDKRGFLSRRLTILLARRYLFLVGARQPKPVRPRLRIIQGGKR